MVAGKDGGVYLPHSLSSVHRLGAERAVYTPSSWGSLTLSVISIEHVILLHRGLVGGKNTNHSMFIFSISLTGLLVSKRNAIVADGVFIYLISPMKHATDETFQACMTSTAFVLMG